MQVKLMSACFSRFEYVQYFRQYVCSTVTAVIPLGLFGSRNVLLSALLSES